MVRAELLKPLGVPRVVPSLVKDETIEEKAQFAALEVLDVELESAAWLQTLG